MIKSILVFLFKLYNFLSFLVSDLAAQMYLLAEAFKKWEVKDIDCQVYVACEASQTANHDKNGQLARDVYKIMKYVYLIPDYTFT